MDSKNVCETELRNHRCLEPVDKIPGDEETTNFRKKARFQQSLWRESRNFKIGTQPIIPRLGQPYRILGSRIDLKEAKSGGLNFLSDDIFEQVKKRVMNKEPFEMLKQDRLYSDLLSSMPMCFNLFGSLCNDLDQADASVHRCWEGIPGRVSAIRFEWSPGRRDPMYLGNQSAFDVAFELTQEDGSHGILGIETKYHEACVPEKIPSESQIERYEQVAAKSGIFESGVSKKILGTDLQQIWQDHLLALSMVQHPEGKWAWSKFVLVHPAKNPSFAKAALRYQGLLSNSESFEVKTIESILETLQLTPEIDSTFRERYLW